MSQKASSGCAAAVARDARRRSRPASVASVRIAGRRRTIRSQPARARATNGPSRAAQLVAERRVGEHPRGAPRAASAMIGRQKELLSRPNAGAAKSKRSSRGRQPTCGTTLHAVALAGGGRVETPGARARQERVVESGAHDDQLAADARQLGEELLLAPACPSAEPMTVDGATSMTPRSRSAQRGGERAQLVAVGEPGSARACRRRRRSASARATSTSRCAPACMPSRTSIDHRRDARRRVAARSIAASPITRTADGRMADERRDVDADALPLERVEVAGVVLPASTGCPRAASRAASPRRTGGAA